MAWTTPGTAVAGAVLSSSFWNEQVRDNLNELYGSIRRLGYATRTSNYTISAASVGAAADIFSSDVTFTALASTAYRVEFYVPYISSGFAASDFVAVNLVDGSGNDLGQIGYCATGDGTRRTEISIMTAYYYTPGAGSISLNVRAHKGISTQNGVMGAGAGGSGNSVPAYLAVFGPALT